MDPICSCYYSQCAAGAGVGRRGAAAHKTHQVQSSLTAREVRQVGCKSPIPKLVRRAFLKLKRDQNDPEAPWQVSSQPVSRPGVQWSMQMCGESCMVGGNFHQDSLMHIGRLSAQKPDLHSL